MDMSRSRRLYERAIKNFCLNPSVKDHIKAINSGVAKNEGTMEIPYDPEDHGSNSIYSNGRSGICDKEKIRLVSAIDALDAIIAENPAAPIVLKIDCEGAEYEILTALKQAGRLGTFKQIMMEWHRTNGNGPEVLEDMLRKTGYSLIVQPHSNDQGMIYAMQK